MPIRGSPNGARSLLSTAPGPVDAIHRNTWTPSIGIAGRHQSESLVAITRCAHFKRTFGHSRPSLPLKTSGKIACGNANRISWDKVCPPSEDHEIYVLGNPPYLGAKELDRDQQSDAQYVFQDLGNVKRLDFIACWFRRATDYIAGKNARYAFVSTNSICQGEQVSLLWPYIMQRDQEIFFAHQPFTWSNSAKAKAGVTCIIAGVRNVEVRGAKHIFSDGRVRAAKNINPYLLEGKTLIVLPRTTPLAKLPKMILGSSGFDGGHLMVSAEERREMIERDARAEPFIKRFLSGDDFINGKERYCLWIGDDEVAAAASIPAIASRIAACREFRLDAGRDARKAAEVPHRFFYRTHQPTNAIIFPKTTSGRRQYVPAGFTDGSSIVSNASFVIYDANLTAFAILSSRMHSVWMSVTSARMRMDYRYSVNLTYNTFPFADFSKNTLSALSGLALNIIDVREKYPELTLGELYDPDEMPDDLLQAHQALDEVLERLYRSSPFVSDEDRLESLFTYYERLLASTARNGSDA